MKRCPNGTNRSKKTGLCEPKTRKKVSNLSFLFLTYADLTHSDVMKAYVKSHDVWIHPKNRLQDEFFRTKVIPEIPTAWGDMSIVRATLLLLKRAVSNPNATWFILLSQDVYPMRPLKELEQFLKRQKHSCFGLQSVTKQLWKTSQWWMLNRADVTTILTHYESFLTIFSPSGVPDELFFLSLLKWKNPDYSFDDFAPVYTRWLENTISKSPMSFNKLLADDIQVIQESKAFFLRKTLPTFSPVVYTPQKQLVVVYVGTESVQQYDTLLRLPVDIIILSAIDLNKIHPALLSKCIGAYNIIYKFFYESILDMCTHPLKWETVIFTSEKFNMNSLPHLSIHKSDRLLPLPSPKLVFRKPIPQKLFYRVKDKHWAFVLTLKKGRLIYG